jgi:hypothetical protein
MWDTVGSLFTRAIINAQHEMSPRRGLRWTAKWISRVVLLAINRINFSRMKMTLQYPFYKHAYI